MKRSLHQRWSDIAINVALVAFVVVPVYAASTIGTNISTGGTLSVTGASTLTGAVTATGGVVSGANVTVPAAYSLDAASTGVLNIGTTTATTINIGRSGQIQALLGNATVAGTLGVTGVTTHTGNLGIGTTTPGTPLGVTGAGVFTGPLTFTWLNATSTTATSTLSTGGLTVGTNQFVVQQTSGSVGVGTTTPSQLFSVHGNSYISGTLYLGAAVTATSTLNVTGLTTLGNASTTQIGSTGSAYFGTTSGNVGVGTTTPSQLFSVHGNSYISGTLYLGAAVTATSTLNVTGLTTLGNASTTQIGSTGSAYFGTTSGSVGVGTTSPWGLSAIEQGTETYSFVVSNNGSSTPALSVNGVNGNGKIGVGTTTPYAGFSIQSNLDALNTDAFVVATSSRAAVFGIDNDGHRFTSGPAPALSSCGTSPSVVGSDGGGTVTNGTSGGGACTLTFAKAFRATPYCNVNTGANTASSSVTSISTSAVTFSIVPNVDSIKLYYSCAYHQ
ncbi:MAG: hypothetical protein HY007_02630 [Candidatus Sungbacteria bacterium]|nr:hypothetical protein [Candidatus Sungbacteria bacterium]